MGNRRNNVADMTIHEQLEDIAERICSDYCKYPGIFHQFYLQNKYENEDQANEAMMEQFCESCPLMRL